MRMAPPKKRPGHQTGLRTLNGAILDVRHAAAFLFGEGNEKKLRHLVDRRLIPHRRLGGRIVFVHAELLRCLESLPGCSLEEAMANDAARRDKNLKVSTWEAQK